MAIFEDNEAYPEAPPAETVKVKIQPPEYAGITVDTKYQPTRSLQAWVEGSNWHTEGYYSQVLGESSEPTPQALNRQPIYQQYRLIKNLVLKVTDPLRFTQDAQLRTMSVTGAGLTFPFVVPTEGDMFIAGIGDGRLGVFTITRATRATPLMDSMYTVEWSMVGELTSERKADFDAKVIETLVYSPLSLVAGCGPFITTESADRQNAYRVIRSEIVKRYLTDFLSREHSTFLVPDQVTKTYDHFITRAILQSIDVDEEVRLRKVRELNVTCASVMGQPTVWDALLYQDPARLYGATQQAQLVSTRYFRGQPNLQAIGYTGINRLVYPLEVPTDVDSQYDGETQHPLVGQVFSEGRPRRPLPGPTQTQAERNLPFFQALALEQVDETTDPWAIPASIHPVVKDSYYVFSEAFYRQLSTGQSRLELLSWQLINRESLNLAQLDSVLESLYDWDNLERFYYHPVVLVLLNYAMRCA